MTSPGAVKVIVDVLRKEKLSGFWQGLMPVSTVSCLMHVFLIFQYVQNFVCTVTCIMYVV